MTKHRSLYDQLAGSSLEGDQISLTAPWPCHVSIRYCHPWGNSSIFCNLSLYAEIHCDIPFWGSSTMICNLLTSCIAMGVNFMKTEESFKSLLSVILRDIVKEAWKNIKNMFSHHKRHRSSKPRISESCSLTCHNL